VLGGEGIPALEVELRCVIHRKDSLTRRSWRAVRSISEQHSVIMERRGILARGRPVLAARLIITSADPAITGELPEEKVSSAS
jgi:hypothetical protein